MTDDSNLKVALDEIGRWSRCKHAILRDYMVEYAKILANFPSLKPVYVDAFCGAGVAVSQESGEVVQGSPLLALDVRPPFHHYHFIDTDGQKTEQLQRLVGYGLTLRLLRRLQSGSPGDSSERVKYEGHWRGVCFLDPSHGLHLNWEVIKWRDSRGRLRYF